MTACAEKIERKISQPGKKEKDFQLVVPQENSIFNVHQNKFTRHEIESRLASYMIKNPELKSYYRISNDQFIMFRDPEQSVAEFVLELASKPIAESKPSAEAENTTENTTEAEETETESAKNADSSAKDESLPLKGIKIGIDPAHIGGDMARAEARFVYMKTGRKLSNGLPEYVEFDEGTLTLATATYLEEMLVEAGAEVFLTRRGIGQSVYHKNYPQWREEDFDQAVEDNIAHIKDPAVKINARNWWKQIGNGGASEAQIFRILYNPLDVDARAAALNAFSGDLNLIFHFNAGSGRKKDGSEENIGTNEQYSMAFVGGGFMKGELKDEESRHNFLRQLLGNEVQESTELCVNILSQHTKEFGVNPVSTFNQFAVDNYLDRSCVRIQDGVYARNLRLTRKVNGVLAYLEPMVQDHLPTAIELNQNQCDFIDGVPTECLSYDDDYLYRTAKTYFDGIMSYFESKKK